MTSPCVTHPDRGAAAACDGCSKPFCASCLVRFEKLSLCGVCKERFLTGVDTDPAPRPRTPAPRGTRPDRPRGARGGSLPWIGGGVALLFAAGFVFVIAATLAQPFQLWSKDRRYGQACERLASLGAALERHRADHGEYPARLEDLVPKYLRTIPEDPYASARVPPRYDRKLLWSVGHDGKDDGGDAEKDIAYAIEPPSHGIAIR